MNPAQIRAARYKLGLSLAKMARMLGYTGPHCAAQLHRMEVGERAIREPQRRLTQAYLDGYRPEDWPGTD